MQIFHTQELGGNELDITIDPETLPKELELNNKTPFHISVMVDVQGEPQYIPDTKKVIDFVNDIVNKFYATQSGNDL